jgi:hypothetical protein
MRGLRCAAAVTVLATVALVCVFACGGTTGGQLVTFPAAAAGLIHGNRNQSSQFTTNRGWHVVLSKAVLHIGALYLNQSQPVSGSQGTNCIFPGTYVAQVTPALDPHAGLDVDLLSPTPQPFSVEGQGTTLSPALVGQVWLTGGDINSTIDTTAILVVAGTAEQNGTTIPFQGRITIGSNRRATGSQAAGGDPICKERIVSIPANVTVKSKGGLLLQIDASLLFTNVDFSQLTKLPDATYGFSDQPNSVAYTSPSLQLYENLRSAGDVYRFSWSDNL